MIDGVDAKPLRVIPDERGRLMEILREDDALFERFGQVYLTTARPGVIKAWHAHRHQADCLTCVQGTIKLALYDDREDSPTCGRFQEFELGEDSPLLVRIPPLVWHGFQNLADVEALVINTVTRPYDHEDPDELRRPVEGDIPYEWERARLPL